MIISIDTTQPLSETDLAVLALLTGEQPVEAPAKASSAPAKKTAAKKTAAKAPAAEPDDEPTDDGPTLEDAVARAQELVGLKLTQGVKDAVKELGAPRVSELKGDQIAEFLELVKDLDADVV